jgi:hypothetical protein
VFCCSRSPPCAPTLTATHITPLSLHVHTFKLINL